MAVCYEELVIEGAKGRGFGFIEGYLAGRGLPAGLLDAEAEGFDVAPLRERLHDLISQTTEVRHLLVPAAQQAAVLAAIDAAAARGIDVRLVARSVLDRASFAFSFHVYSKDHAPRVRALFERLPEGVALGAESTIEERRDSGARGAEVYAPAHEFELRGAGRVHGPVDGVLDVFRRARNEPLVRLEGILLERAA